MDIWCKIWQICHSLLDGSDVYVLADGSQNSELSRDDFHQVPSSENKEAES